jgi:hypothetical protein
MIFELFNIDIHRYPTLSALAFAIFRTHFLKENEIPQLSGQIAKDIRQSYTGKPVQFFGNIRNVDPNAFGFFFCKIIAPDNLKHPIIQTHVKTKAGIRSIAPLGT